MTGKRVRWRRPDHARNLGHPALVLAGSPVNAQGMKVAGSYRDRRHRGQVELYEPGQAGPLPLERLREFRAEPPGRVLSAHIAVDSRRGEALDAGWRLRFKAAVRDLAARCADRGEADALVALVRWIEPRLTELPPGDQHRGVALFATERPRRLAMLILPHPVADSIAWADAADLTQLERMAEAHPTCGLVVVGGRVARLITTRLGVPTGETIFRFHPATEDWRRMTGPAPAQRIASGTTQVDRFARRVTAHETRWLKGLITRIIAAARAGDWASAIVVTPPDIQLATDELEAAGVPVRREIRGTFSHRSAQEIASIVFDELAQ